MDISRIVARYLAGDSLRALSRDCGVCTATLRRILITEGVALRDGAAQAERIRILAQDHSVEEIASMLCLKPSTVSVYLPYTKGSYSIGDKTANAKRIARYRERKGRRHL